MVDATQYDWTQFDLYHYYPAPLEKVWHAWATPEGLCSFFVETCTGFDTEGNAHTPQSAFVPGGSYKWKWRHDFAGEGSIFTVEPMSHLAFSFGAAMRVDVHLQDVGSSVRVHLHQSQIPDSEEGHVIGHMNCRSCWIFFMTNLVSVLQNGIDLRHEDPTRVSSMEVGFTPPAHDQKEAA